MFSVQFHQVYISSRTTCRSIAVGLESHLAFWVLTNSDLLQTPLPLPRPWKCVCSSPVPSCFSFSRCCGFALLPVLLCADCSSACHPVFLPLFCLRVVCSLACFLPLLFCPFVSPLLVVAGCPCSLPPPLPPLVCVYSVGQDCCRSIGKNLHYPWLQRTPKTHPVTTPRFNLAFVKLGNFDEITADYDKCEKAVKSPWNVSGKAMKRPWNVKRWFSMFSIISCNLGKL